MFSTHQKERVQEIKMSSVEDFSDVNLFIYQAA